MKQHPQVVTRRGSALIDVIIGGMLLAIGLGVIISLTSRSLRTQTDGEKRLVASWLADELLTMVLVEGPAEYPKLYDTAGRFDEPFDEFVYDVDIEDQGIGVPFEITATVGWEGARGDRFVQVQTHIAERRDDPEESRVPIEPIDRNTRWSEYDER